MRIERVFTRRVLATTPGASLSEAAAMMRRYQVGSLLVVDAAAVRMPVGIVTDRDLALQGLASQATTVAEAMTAGVISIGEDADLHDALEMMRVHAVRRLVVTGADGQVVGIISIDDVVSGLAAELAAAAAALNHAPGSDVVMTQPHN